MNGARDAGRFPDAETLFAGVIGDPVRHSLSPALHNAAFAALGLNWAYGAFPVAPGEVGRALQGARALGFVGLSVTMPHKAAVARACEQVSETVARLEAANTVVYRAGVPVGESTDGAGLLDDLAEAEAFDPAGARCAVLGAGGAARAVVLALAEAGAAEVLVVNRTPERAVLAAALAGKQGRAGDAEELADAALVVNATPLGMLPDGAPAGGATAAEAGAALGERLGAGQLAVDLVYGVGSTPFLTAAAARGARTRDGLGMLVGQAARQVELWTGEPAPREAMRAAVGL